MSTYTGGQFVVGNIYKIATIGGTSFTSIGASSDLPGVSFQATGTGAGITGTAYGTDIIPVATGASPNVMSPVAYATLLQSLAGNSLPNGYILPAELLNNMIRQATFIAAGLASWLVEQGISVPDDGNLVNLVSEMGSAFSQVPTGMILPFSGITVPTGFIALPVAATTKSRTTYAALNTVLAADGYPWGVGDGSTTFNIPFVATGGALRNGGTIGANDVGVVLNHTHSIPSYSTSGQSGSGQATIQAGYVQTFGQTPAGGASNIPAGSNVNWCIKY